MRKKIVAGNWKMNLDYNEGLALFSEIATGVLQIAQAVVKLFTDLIQDTVGFIFSKPSIAHRTTLVFMVLPANFFLVLILGGAYYWYTNGQGSNRRGKKKAL